MRHRFADKRLEESFLFEQRLKCVCDLRIWIDERGRSVRRGSLFLCFGERLDGVSSASDTFGTGKACLERKHVLLQEQVGPRANRELDTILGTPR